MQAQTAQGEPLKRAYVLFHSEMACIAVMIGVISHLFVSAVHSLPEVTRPAPGEDLHIIIFMHCLCIYLTIYSHKHAYSALTYFIFDV